MDKEIRNKVRKYKAELLWEERKRQELLNTNIDYEYIQKLLNMCNENPDLVITIYFKSGNRMVLQTKHKETDYLAESSYDGEPSRNEMEIR